MDCVTVIGAGLAGSEAAHQCALRGIPVTLWEMKPAERTPAHKYDGFAELVCSNSLRSDSLTSAAGLLKREMQLMGSIVIEAALATRVGAGGALAVDRTAFSDYITKKLGETPLITIKTRRVDKIPPRGRVIIATGPLTDGPLADNIKEFFGDEYLNFYDASSPLVDFNTIDMSKAFFASRYDKGGADYINCPMTEDEYKAFVFELVNAQEVEIRGFEDGRVFEACMPVEVMARRGEDTLRFGPLKPIGLKDPRTGKMPYAVVQLRRDNAAGNVYNMVGFQTHLKFPEQKRIFSMIPGLENAEFLRFGVMHRNSYINSPKLLDHFYRARNHERIAFAGQLTGVEGYIESAASGLYAGAVMAYEIIHGRTPPPLPRSTATGALAAYISSGSNEDFQPMNINYGIIDSSSVRVRGKANRKTHISEEALETVLRSVFAAHLQ